MLIVRISLRLPYWAGCWPPQAHVLCYIYVCKCNLPVINSISLIQLASSAFTHIINNSTPHFFKKSSTSLCYHRSNQYYWFLGMKTVRIFSDRIRDRIRLVRFRSVRIRVRIFNIRYRIRIRIFKSYIYDVDIQSYLIRHDWYYPYSDPNPITNMKTNMISVISVRIRSVFIPADFYQLHTFFLFTFSLSYRSHFLQFNRNGDLMFK